MSYLSYIAINQNTDKKDESCEKLVIAKIGGPLVLFYGAFVGAFYGVCAGASEVEIVDWMFDKITFQS